MSLVDGVGEERLRICDDDHKQLTCGLELSIDVILSREGLCSK